MKYLKYLFVIAVLSLTIVAGSAAGISQNEDPGGGGNGNATACRAGINGAILYLWAAPSVANPYGSNFRCGAVNGPGYYIFSAYYGSDFWVDQYAPGGGWYPGNSWFYQPGSGYVNPYWAWQPIW